SGRSYLVTCPPPWIAGAALRDSEPPAQPCALRCAPMKVELWSISRVKPYEKNPRLNDDAVDAIKVSIREFGFRQPIVVDADGVIICGHTRYKAALKLGLKKVPVHVAKDLTSEQIKAYRIADNQTSSLSDWDYALLPLELAELQGMNYDLGLLGFDQDELLAL